MTHLVYRYHAINGVTIRQLFDLDADPPESGIDWLHIEPWIEPPSRVPDVMRPRGFDMRCNACGYTAMKKGVCNCRRCGKGWMRRIR